MDECEGRAAVRSLWIMDMPPDADPPLWPSTVRRAQKQIPAGGGDAAQLKFPAERTDFLSQRGDGQHTDVESLVK